MKTRKTIIAIAIMSVFAMLFVFSGCSMSGGDSGKDSDSNFVGTWKAESCEYEGVQMSVEDLLGEFTIELKDGGKCVVSVNGETSSCSWREDGTNVYIKDKGEELCFTSEGNQLTMDYQGVKLFFSKTK